MLKEKETQLKERLRNIITEIGYMNDVKQAIGDEFKSRGLNALRASWAFSERLDLNTLTDSEEDIRFLFLFTYSLSNALKGKTDIEINVEDYFTKVECDKWKGYKEEVSTSKNIYPIVFEDVQQVNEKTWQFVMSIQQLNKLDAENLLIYNFRTQRNPKITVAGEKINLDTNKVNEIKERLLDGKQFPTTIKLNVLRTGEDRIIYNSKNRTLTIEEGSFINIIDGYHRKVASALACENNSNIQFNWQMTITNMTEKEAHDYMVEIDKQKPIKREYIESKDYNKSENLIVDAIMDDRLSELAKVMKDDDSYIKLNRALTKKSIIAHAIKENYEDELKVGINIRNIARWIIEVTDYLMGLYTDEFIVKPYQIKESSNINHKNIFYGYIALSKALYGNKDWKELLKHKMDSIDFDKNNTLWRDIGLIGTGDANKTLRYKLYNLFKEGIVL